MGSGKSKFLLAAAIAGVGLLVSSSVVSAAPVVDFRNLVVSGYNNFTDSNGEELIDPQGMPTTSIDVGDTLYGVLDFNRVYNPASPSGQNIGGVVNPTYSEMTGVFALKVTGKVLNGTVDVTSTITVPNYNFTFAPDTATLNAKVAGLNAPNGTIVALFDGMVPDFSMITPTGVAGSIATASNGIHLLNAGFTGAGGTAAAGEGWIGSGSDLFSLLATIDGNTTLGKSNFSLNIVGPNTSGINIIAGLESTINGTTLVDFTGSSTIKGVKNNFGTTTSWASGSQTNLGFVAVPLPASFWSGVGMMGVLGVGMMMRRRTATLS